MIFFNLNDIRPNPELEAILNANGETLTVSGYVAKTSKSTIALTKDLQSRYYSEYPRNALVAAYHSNKKSNRITLVVLQAADVGHVNYVKAKSHTCSCKDGDEVGVCG